MNEPIKLTPCQENNFIVLNSDESAEKAQWSPGGGVDMTIAELLPLVDPEATIVLEYLTSLPNQQGNFADAIIRFNTLEATKLLEVESSNEI
jgi:hypothetical protein